MELQKNKTQRLTISEKQRLVISTCNALPDLVISCSIL